MCLTDIVMAPLMPGNAGLESIGSVAANFARQDAEEASTDLRRWMDESPRSSVNDSIVSEYGPANYAEFAAWERIHAERGQREDEARREFRVRLLRRPRRCYRLLRESWKRAFHGSNQ